MSPGWQRGTILWLQGLAPDHMEGCYISYGASSSSRLGQNFEPMSVIYTPIEDLLRICPGHTRTNQDDPGVLAAI
jgi:hypothetical protein